MSGFSHDFIIDLATSLPDITDTEMESSTMSWGLNLDYLDDEIEDTMTTSNELNLDHVNTPPTSAPAASLNVVVLPRNSEVAVLCGCRGNFTWELIPTNYCNCYLFPHLVNTVDHTVGTCKLLSTFTEAVWEGYNMSTRQILNKDNMTDFSSLLTLSPARWMSIFSRPNLSFIQLFLTLSPCVPRNSFTSIPGTR